MYYVLWSKNSYFHIYICNKAILILHLFKNKIVLIFRTGNVDNVLKSCNRDWYHRLSVEWPFLCLSVYELSSILGIDYKTACHTSRMNNGFILIYVYILVIISLLLGGDILFLSCPSVHSSVRSSQQTYTHNSFILKQNSSKLITILQRFAYCHCFLIGRRYCIFYLNYFIKKIL